MAAVYPWNPAEYALFSGVSSTPGSFALRGGQYGVTVKASFGGGSVTLQRLSPDASTYVTCLSAFTTDGYATANLPTGTYRLLVATATQIYADVVSVITGAAA